MDLNLLLIGMMSYGITGNILSPPFCSISLTPMILKNRYGSNYSLKPSKKIGK